MPSAQSTLKAGQRFASWTLRRPLGKGAFGTTWEVVGPNSRLAALKLTGTVPVAELWALSQICHPSVPTLLGGGSEPEAHLVMQRMSGHPLVASRFPLATPLAMFVITNLADALAAVHQVGLAHGDVKPENVLLDAGRRPSCALVDFGGVQGKSVTYSYAAPERFEHGQATAASDVYALGVLAWESLTGERPWELIGGSSEHTGTDAKLPPTVEWLTSLLERMLHRDPDMRPTAREFADELAAHGHIATPPTAQLVDARRRTVHVGQERYENAIIKAVDAGESVWIGGPRGSGKSHLIDHVALTLATRGVSVETVPAIPTPNQPFVSAGTQVLLVDDVDLLSDETLKTLRGHAQSHQVCIVATGHEQPPWIERAITLEPFAGDDASELVGRLLGATGPTHALVDRLVDLVGGNPGRLAAAVVHAIEAKVVVHRLGRWHVENGKLATLDIKPENDEHGLDTLSDNAKHIAAALGVLGARVSSHELARAAGTTEERTRAGIDELTSAGLIDPVGQMVSPASMVAARQCAAFAPDITLLKRRWLDLLIANRPPDPRCVHLLAELGTTEEIEAHGLAVLRAAMSRDPGGALLSATQLNARVPSATTATILSVVAHQAGDTTEALRAAQGVLSDASSSEALRFEVHLTRAALLAAGNDGVDDGWSDLQTCLSLAHDEIQRWRAAEAIIQWCRKTERYNRAVAYAEPFQAITPAEPAPVVAAYLGIVSAEAQSMHALGWTELALERLASLPRSVGGRTGARALLDGVRSRLQFHHGQLRDAAATIETATEAHNGLTNTDRARVLNNAAILQYALGDGRAAIDRWEQALVLFEALGDHHEATRTRVNLCYGYRLVGRYTRATVAGERAAAAAKSGDWHDLHAMSLGNLCDIATATRDFTTALERHAEATKIATAHKLQSELTELARRRAEIALLADHTDAHAWVARAVRTATQAGDELESLRCAALAAVIAARRGHHAASSRKLKQALDGLTALGAAPDAARARAWGAVAAVASGDTSEAIQLLDSADRYAREVRDVELMQRIALLRAEHVAVALVQPPRPSQAAVFDACTRLLTADDHAAAMQDVAVALSQAFNMERVFILAGDDLSLAARAGTPGEHADGPSGTVVRRCARIRRPIFVANLDERGDLRRAASLVSLSVRTVACVPLLMNGKFLGLVYADAKTPKHNGWNELEGLFHTAAEHLAASLNHRLTTAALQHRVDAYERHLAARDDLLSAFSHEISTPLHAIVSHVSEAREQRTNPRVHALLGIAEQQALTAVRRLRNVIEFADAKPANDEASNLPFRLQDMARATSERVRSDHPVHVTVEAGANHLLKGPASAYEEAIIGLANTLIGMGDGGASIHFKHDEDSNTISVEVTCPHTYLSHTVQQALRAPSSGKSDGSRVGGLSLDLAMTRFRFASLDGGTDLVHTGTDGTTLRAWVPAAIMIPRRGITFTDAEPPTRVLVVDDNLINQRVLAAMVAKYGYEVDTASDGQEAVRSVSNTRYLMVFMDVHMPEVDGLEATLRIRRLPGEAGLTPVVAVTADLRPSMRAECLAAGMDAVLTKPIRSAHTAEALSRAAAQWGAPPPVLSAEAGTDPNTEDTDATVA